MLLDFGAIAKDRQLSVTGVIHVGAHTGEEKGLYAGMGVPVFWIEANPFVLAKLQAAVLSYYAQNVIHALVLDEKKEGVTFNITNYDGMSSSVFNWGTHTQFSPDTVIEQTITLDSTTLDQLDSDYNFTGCNMLNIDIEGAGLLALKGAKRLLAQIEVLYLEVQTENVYDGAPLLPEYDEYLTDFNRVELGMVEGQGWGDALYLRK